jgi:hypothetical protein
MAGQAGKERRQEISWRNSQEFSLPALTFWRKCFSQQKTVKSRIPKILTMPFFIKV